MTNTYVGPNRRMEDSSSDVWTRRFTAWGSMAVTVAIFILLGYDLIATSRLEDKQAFNGLNETIKAMAMIAVGFWLGSSNSGQKKDDALAASASKKDDALATTAIESNKTIAAAIPVLANSSPSVVTTTTEATAGTVTTKTEPSEKDEKTP